jgi:hypothetical protein
LEDIHEKLFFIILNINFLETWTSFFFPLSSSWEART